MTDPTKRFTAGEYDHHARAAGETLVGDMLRAAAATERERERVIAAIKAMLDEADELEVAMRTPICINKHFRALRKLAELDGYKYV